MILLSTLSTLCISFDDFTFDAERAKVSAHRKKYMEYNTK
jgi:hypothetical protein